MRRVLLALVFSLVAIVSAAAQSYPKEVEAVLDAARQECKDADDGKATFYKDTVRKIELSGDKRDDYVVNLHEASCSTFQSIYCGTGGCNFTILVAKPNGSYATVFDGRAHSYTILNKSGPRRLKFHLHGGFCGKSGPYPCYKTRTITTKPFDASRGPNQLRLPCVP